MKTWKAAQILKTFRSNRSSSTLKDDAEKRGLIPLPINKMCGSTKTRIWQASSLPEIGKHYGFLDKKTRQDTIIICIYVPKGGVQKSTLAFNLARIFALHNIDTLLIGLEILQKSIHRKFVRDYNPQQVVDGIFSVIKDKCSIQDVIKPSDLPTLHYIPESTSSLDFEDVLRNCHKREYVLDRTIEPIKKKFDVIILDNSSYPGLITQNALCCATDIIAPCGCDIESFQSITENIKWIDKYRNKMDLNWNSFMMVRTGYEMGNSMSQDCSRDYGTKFGRLMVQGKIRRLIKGQESSLQGISVIEHAPTSRLSDDYFEITTELWNRINHGT